ncbi:Zinc finger protein 36, C3H1 type-like 1 [Oryzias melastigma]|uniref:mRNA decay activator protein ZFP36 n=1 Tax=Oryzias melastigma TaxID=30732 RepID=A0A3B3CNZ6_ORYME|nr:mRNA decay activator protein ZFP36L1 [Oryzias melastigma]KAF6732052.1 Zinc finger protein 36, C3H1 type-like 1 [Oryzias melastigma]
MPSDFLTPFLEVDEEFCKNFSGLEAADGSSCSSHHRVLGFQRRHSLCPVTLPNSKFNSSSELVDSGCWGLGLAPQQPWNRELPRSSLSHIPFRVDRSVSMIEGRADKSASPPLLLPPPGLCVSSNGAAPSRAPVPPPHISTRYKTELCRTYEESGSCKYGAKCQFAHGLDELRGLSRHPKYKTEPCRTFHTIGFCPYGARCHFIHNDEEIQAAPHRQKLRPPPLRHSLSFAGFSSSRHAFQPVDSLLFTRASSVSPPPSSIGSPELLSPLFPEPGTLRHCPHLFTGIHDLSGDGGFSAATDSSFTSSSSSSNYKPLPPHLPLQDCLGLQRSSSADSLSEEGYTSSCSLSSSSSGAESPSFEGRRLPIFSRLSVSDE